MQKKKNRSQVVQTAEKCTSLTGCALSVAITEEGKFFQKQQLNKIPTLGIDLLGGDTQTPTHVLDTLDSLYSETEGLFCLALFVTPEMIAPLEAFRIARGIEKNALKLITTSEIIEMDDDPLVALRKKRGASMFQGMQLLKEKKIDALLSTGNTGALVASAMMTLSMLPGISRAALMTLLPTQKDPVAVIDVGANIECTPVHLVDFAKMGIAYQKSRGIEKPIVGLLNIGTEEKKGRRELRETYQLLQNLHQETALFAGNIEGKEVFNGKIHVLVTDGFTGNIFLKTAEGISAFILETMHKNKNLIPFSKPLLKRLEEELYSAEYPGAILCGIDGIIVKCHGDASPKALKYGFQGALDLVENNFLFNIKAQI